MQIYFGPQSIRTQQGSMPRGICKPYCFFSNPIIKTEVTFFLLFLDVNLHTSLKNPPKWMTDENKTHGFRYHALKRQLPNPIIISRIQFSNENMYFIQKP